MIGYYYPDPAKDFTQQAVYWILIQFQCCGFEKADQYQYTGKSSNFWGANKTPENHCTIGNQFDGCYSAGDVVYSNFVRMIGRIGVLVCLVSILAASTARKRRLLIILARVQEKDGRIWLQHS